MLNMLKRLDRRFMHVSYKLRFSLCKVRAYCTACDHLIRKISSGMFQESCSIEEF